MTLLLETLVVGSLRVKIKLRLYWGDALTGLHVREGPPSMRLSRRLRHGSHCSEKEEDEGVPGTGGLGWFRCLWIWLSSLAWVREL